MSDTMTRGYVYSIGNGVFGILAYAPTTTVYLKLYRDTPSTVEAVRRLNAEHAGIFSVATADEKAWGEKVYGGRQQFATAI